MQYLKTAQLYFKSLISCFDVLAISEHCLFEEQLDFFDKISNSSHNYTAVCSNDNPHLLSGKNAHGGVALLWKHMFDNFITPLKNIDSDRIVGIRYDFPNCPLLFILGVYLPSASHDKTEYDEYFDHLWSLYDSLSIQGVVIALGDFNGDLGNSLGDKGKHAPNSCGLKLLELCSHFNICAVNLLSSCNGPVETFVSHCGRFRSTIDYIFVSNSLLNQVITAKTFEMLPDNTSDHVPVQMYLNYSRSLETIKNLPQQMAEIPVSKQKIHWSNFAQEEIIMMYRTPLISELEILNPDVQNVCKHYVKSITKLILAHSQCLAAPIRKRKRNKMTYVSLPTNVKSARKQCKAAFDSWKNNDFNTTGEIHDDYRYGRKEYRSLLRDFFNQLEVQKIDRLCTAAETDEKLFWKLLKGRRNSSQMHAFLVEGKLLSDVDQIRDMWANHFEALGTPFASSNFDNDFYDRVTTHVQGIFINCTEDSSGVLNEPLQYEEVAKVCSRLKRGTSGVLIDYEHILFACPPLWKHLFCLFQEFFLNGSICSTLKTGIILPLFKGKGAKANNKDNYRGITLFPTLCKIYEIILLNRLENYASHNQYFSEMQFGFQEGVGCTEASFTILETINHMLERGSKIFGCFLDVRKAFDTVWIDGLLYKLFTEFGIKGRMWVAIKDLYTDVKARVLYSGSLSRSFDVSQGTGQGRILAPFIYNVYINSLLHVLTDHCYSICINSSKLASPPLPMTCLCLHYTRTSSRLLRISVMNTA